MAGLEQDGHQRYKVVAVGGLSVLEHPDHKSRRLCHLVAEEVVETTRWDASGQWRLARTPNDEGQPVEGWCQVRSEAHGVLMERFQGPPTAAVGAPAEGLQQLPQLPQMAGGQGGEQLDDLLAMQRLLQEKLRALGVQAQAFPAEQPPGEAEQPEVPAAQTIPSRPSKFAAYAKDCGLSVNDSNLEEAEDLKNAKDRMDVGQIYEVVYKPKIAVRQRPSLNAPSVRVLFAGQKVMLYEWDKTRQWRRLPVDRAIDEDEIIMEGDGIKEGTIRDDGWILIEHPTHGPLLRAVSLFPQEEEEPPGQAEFVAQGIGAAELEAALSEAGRQGRPGAEGAPADGTEEAPRMVPKLKMTFEDRRNKLEDTWHDNWAPQGPGMFGQVRELDREVLRADQKLKAELEYENQVLASVEDRGLHEPKLMRAVRSGNYEVVRGMLSRCVNLSVTDSMGETALFEASASSRIDMVSLLLLCKANPAKKSKEGLMPAELANDSMTVALLNHWNGQNSDRRLLLGALLRTHAQDRRRLCQEVGVAEEELRAFEDQQRQPQQPPQQLQPPPDKPPERVEPQAEAPAIKGAASPRQASPRVPATEAAPSPRSEAGAPEPAEPEDIPERTEVPTQYQVIYKMVAVRRSPDPKAESMKAIKKGTKIDMYEFDRTRNWRRVRIEAPKGEGEDAPTEMTDGWMLLRSDKVGLLLQEITEEEDDDEDEAI